VNWIERYGKWVFSCHENNVLNVYDIGQERCKVPPHAYFADGPVKKVVIDSKQYVLYIEVMAVHPESKLRLQPVVWQPRWEAFGGVDLDKRWRHQVEILKQEKRTLLKELDEMKTYSKALEDDNGSLQEFNEKMEKELLELREALKLKDPENPILKNPSVLDVPEKKE